MRFDILTIFPEVFPAYLNASILGRAKEAGLLETQLWNIRDYATDKHKTVDDSPYGGGPGMVMKVEPIDRALSAIKVVSSKQQVVSKKKIVVLSARGKQFTQQKAAEYAKFDQLVLICGRYEGIDQRVAEHLADEELSLGPYVLAGGEIAALAVIEATARLIPGVLGNEASLAEESFSGNSNIETRNSKQIQNSKFKKSKPVSDFGFRASDFTLEYPQYTKPEDYNGWKVPKILLSGNHAIIREWRRQHSRK